MDKPIEIYEVKIYPYYGSELTRLVEAISDAQAVQKACRDWFAAGSLPAPNQNHRPSVLVRRPDGDTEQYAVGLSFDVEVNIDQNSEVSPKYDSKLVGVDRVFGVRIPLAEGYYLTGDTTATSQFEAMQKACRKWLDASVLTPYRIVNTIEVLDDRGSITSYAAILGYTVNTILSHVDS